VRPSEVRLKVMSKYTSKSTSSGVKITRNRWAQLEQSSSSSEEMEQRTPRKSSRKGEADKGEREKTPAGGLDTPKQGKRPREEEGEGLEGLSFAAKVEEQRDKLRRMLAGAGADSQEIMGALDSFVNTTVELVKEAFGQQMLAQMREEMKVMMESREKEKEESRGVAIREQVAIALEKEKCSRSLIIHNADKFVTDKDKIYTYGIDWGLAPSVAGAVYRMSNGMVTANEAFTIGKWKNGRPPTSVVVVLESTRMKGVFFRLLAARIRTGDDNQGYLKQVSVRDMFPASMLQESRREVRRGMALKRNGYIGTFKVVSRGTGCIPVLEIKKRVGMNGQQGPWEVFQDNMLSNEQKERVDKELQEQQERIDAAEQARQDWEDEMYMNEIETVTSEFWHNDRGQGPPERKIR